MGYHKLIQDNVKMAFNTIGDIAEDITFTNNKVDGYNFATQSISENTDAPITVKAVIESQYRTNDDKPRLECNLMIDSANLDSKLIGEFSFLRIFPKARKLIITMI